MHMRRAVLTATSSDVVEHRLENDEYNIKTLHYETHNIGNEHIGVHAISFRFPVTRTRLRGITD